MEMTTTLEFDIDQEIKTKAEQVLSSFKLSPSDAIALLYGFIAEEEALPFSVPNGDTIAAIEAARRGEVASFDTVEELMADLHAED